MILHRLAYRPFLWGHFLSEESILSFQIHLGLCPQNPTSPGVKTLTGRCPNRAKNNKHIPSSTLGSKARAICKVNTGTAFGSQAGVLDVLRIQEHGLPGDQEQRGQAAKDEEGRVV